MRSRANTASGCAILVGVVLLGGLIGIGLTSLVVGAAVGFLTFADDIFIQPVLRVENTIITFDPIPRLLMFGVRLLLTLGGALSLLYLFWHKRRTDALALVLAATLGCVLLSLSVTSWLMIPLLQLPMLP